MKKANENFNFILHKKYNIELLKSHVLSYTDREWLLDTTRQKDTIHHTKTQSYKISFFDFTTDFSNYTLEMNDGVDKELVEMIMPILNDMAKVYNGKAGRILLTRLSNENDITPHTDLNEYFNLTRRFHLPIITNEMVDFYVGDEMINMKEGECWEINNKRMHKVINNGSEARVHLLFDVIPGNLI